MSPHHWLWNGSRLDFESWQGVLGFDTTGSEDAVLPRGLPPECLSVRV